MSEITDEQRAAEAAACPCCRARAASEWAAAMEEQTRVHLIETNALRAELSAAVDALRPFADKIGPTMYYQRAAAIVAAYDAKPPERK